MVMTKPELLEYLYTMMSGLSVDLTVIQKELNSIKTAGNVTNADRAHLDWEIVHLKSSYQDFMRDIGRVVKTLEGKKFNAD